jgi:23S rRNA (uracil1939-C5)-methyltransferase
LQKIAPKGKIEFTAGKVRPTLAECEETYDGVVLDPPRGGISYRVFKHINRIAKITDEPVKVIYVSCSIKNFLRDAKYFTDELGWRLQSLTGVDQFVHTPHLETVAEFEI